jgi:squalene-associated FAD-dependent desaturase
MSGVDPSEAEGGPAGTDVIVVGGGLAGITAALACADAGRRVVLLESRPRLGGRTASFHRADRDGDDGTDGTGGTESTGPGLDVDTGQHVFMRCCVAYRQLLGRLGVDRDVDLQARLDVPVVSGSSTGADGRLRSARIKRVNLPAPLQLGPALATYALLSPARRVKLLWAALALKGVDADSAAADGQSFAGWLRAHGQDAAAIEALWDLITVATLNAPAEDSSLALAATVFQVGLLTDRAAGDLGWSRVPLGRLHGDAAATAFAAAGVEVRPGAKVTGVEEVPGVGWRVRLGEQELTAARLVLAVPPPAAEALLPGGAVDLAAGWAGRLGSSPIVNVHVVYDRTVLDEPFLAAVDSPVQWMFDRTQASGLAARNASAGTRHQYVAVSLSAAGDLVGRPAKSLLGEMLAALEALLPKARQATVIDAFVTREPTATFAPAPGTAADRPPARTRRPGLYLAGSWTATGWPDTMESAVRSGNAAAAALLADPILSARENPSPRAEEVPA